ncbi:osmotically inducible protein OsmC [Adhaeribacter arboris]|uniref:Osmotically inducible protein OsmC n=1 Tax=Adhaeribacter arboris TaxID=2072846 RepID=A0A2T2YDR7_9BACT|nr:OsmC family protein [Adhaeribacter arboris]PSR53657.1 osmotically inducible protein OsmC [Adhaeribacter arboris]
MNISASIKNSYQANKVSVVTNGNVKEIQIPGKTEGYGSSVNGGELLFLSLATCFCNDVYREAARKKITIESVEVTVAGEFGKEGEPAATITYEVKVQSTSHSSQEITTLIQEVDQVAEVHNTLRKGVRVTLIE